MSTQTGVNFADMSAPVNEKSIKNPGIYRKMEVKSFKYVPSAPKKDDKNQPVMTNGQPVISKAYTEVIVGNEDDGNFKHMYFEVSSNPADVTYFSKVYVDNIPVRDKTAEEQIASDLMNYAYFLVNLMQALGNTFDNARRVLVPAKTFKEMTEAVIKACPNERMMGKYIDVKIICKNNINKKSSFMQIADANSKNVVMCMWTDKPKSDIDYTKYELEKQSVVLFPYGSASANAPKAGIAAELDNTPLANNGYVNSALAAQPEGDLF